MSDGRPCECEHAAHFDHTVPTPDNNPGHHYGVQFVSLYRVRTDYGTFMVCSDCAKDCQRQISK